MGKLATFSALAPAERRAAIEALWELTRAAFVVAFARPRRWQDEALAAPSRPSDGATLRLVRIAIARANANLGWLAPKCLPQALAARRMLARRGIGADLYLGTALLAGPTEDRFHAWLKVGDSFVTGGCDEGRYARFAAPHHAPHGAGMHTNA